MIDFLRKIGLNKYESLAYLALLKIGPSSAFSISKESEVPFGRIYDSLNKLMHKGFVEVVPSKPKKYSAVKPETAVNGFLDVKSNSIEKLRKNASKFINKAKQAHSSKDKVSVNTGKKNFAKTVAEHFNYEKEFWATSEEFALEKNYPALQRYIKGDPSKRYVLIDYDKTDKKRIKELIDYGLNLRHYPLKNVRILISDEELVTISIQDKEFTNIHIKSKALGKALTKIMKTVWSKAKTLSS